MSTKTGPMVELSVHIEARPETVWTILTTPSRFSAWMDGEVAFEPRAGSPFRAEFPRFQTVVAGEIARLDEEGRTLAVTWGVESGPQAETFPAGTSVVEFRVLEEAEGARVELRHSGLPSDHEAEQHEGGWRFHFSRLSLFANREDLSRGLERTLERWFEAWNEPDDAARRKALEACCAEGVGFRDEWAAAEGLDRLHEHIGNTLRFVPGWRLEGTGDVRICRGEALVGWRGVGPGGGSTEGMNHVRARPDGTILRVVGFPES
ncbi:MAG: SRPBCC domain-containing protein [Gemmatimonadota bacterium]|nr:SRPBCC domain-containing protein [Gemmatimonadota bacterium]